MTNASFGIDRAVRLSVMRIYPLHSAHTNACPGMVTDDVYATGPHGEALLGSNVPSVGDAQSPHFDGLRDQEEDDESAKWYGQQQNFLMQSEDDTTSCNKAAPGAACLGHQQGCSDEEQSWYQPHKLPAVRAEQHLHYSHEFHQHEEAGKRHFAVHRATDPKIDPVRKRLGQTIERHDSSSDNEHSYQGSRTFLGGDLVHHQIKHQRFKDVAQFDQAFKGLDRQDGSEDGCQQ